MVFEADFVSGVILSSTKSKAGHGLQRRRRSPRSRRARTRPAVEISGDLFVTFRDTPGDRGVREVPRDARGRGRVGEGGRLRDRQPQRQPERLPGRDRPLPTRRPSRTAKSVVFDMSDEQPAAFGSTTGQGEWGHLPDVPEEPEQRHRRRRSSSRRLRRRPTRRAASALSAGGISVEPPVAAAPPPAGEPGRFRPLPDRARVFLAPAFFLLGVWLVFPTVYTIVRSFFGPTGFIGSWVGIDNYKTLFTTSTLTTAIKNNAIWVAVVPALVTAIGLIFAVLTERVRWAVAFKTAVFLPMAISAFATGVTWRIMYQQDPGIGRDQRARRGRSTASSARPACSRRRSRRPRRCRRRPDGGLVLKTPLAPGGVALLGLDGHPADRRAQGRRPGGQAGGEAGRDRRRRLARLQAGRRQAGRRREGRARPAGRDRAASRLGGRQDRAVGQVEPDGTFDFTSVAPGSYRAAIGVADLRQAVRRLRLARAEADHAVADDRLHLDLGRASRWW